MTRFYLLIVSALLFSCNGNESNNEEPSKVGNPSSLSDPPQLDLTSPTKSVQTLWNWQIWSDTTIAKVDSIGKSDIRNIWSYSLRTRFYESLQQRVGQYKQFHYLMNSTIEKVDMVNDSTANVFAMQYLYNGDDTPSLHKFEVTRNDSRWYVNNYYEQCQMCDKKGWSKYDNGPCKFCSYGWTNQYIRN